ncbi:Aste57867_21035 [Aphanomyces stellatus]|uniref:Aste57867_21035 protein n=1 Tax=Aphanomyces stellatus TaxID=120398 RepID=A0A485LHW6_9STRA|nr:hypothetical protein As57867_020967 [Aphanomyces stellatus]VFT97710.1 Aste57867_21035 [Aphanomyces stellatus]
MPMLRTFSSRPSFSADWNGNYEEKSAQWFELFMDLIMVAACANVADKLKDDLTHDGFLNYLLVFTMYVASWQKYTFFNARFSEDSFVHYSMLYVLLAGLGGMVMAGDPSPGFTIGLLLVRVAMVLMYLNVYFQLHETRKTLWIEILLSGSSSLVLLTSLFLPSSCTVPCYVVCFFIEVIFRYIWAFQGWFLDPDHPHIPMNIEHTSERYGCFVMVVLGEAILSSTINTKPSDKANFTTRYYAVMLLSFLVNFSMAMYYFAMRPPRKFHAMRRGLLGLISFVVLHLCLLPSLLTMSVSTKLIADAVLKQAPLESSSVWTLFGAMALALAFMFGIRLAHFVGVQPAPHDPIEVKMIKYHWWVLVGLSPLIPCGLAIALEYVSGGRVDPIHALIVASAFMLLWVVIETALMHWLVKVGNQHKLKEHKALLSPKKSLQVGADKHAV